MKRTILLYALLAVALTLNAQSTDKVKYYILYDVSGSVNMSGSKKNLAFLANRLLELKNGSSTIEVSIEFIPFGAADGDLQSVKVNRYDENLATNRETLFSVFTEATNRSEQYTHLQAALNKINSNRRDDGFTSYGVFILCDGQMQLGDVANVKSQFELDNYIDKIKSNINNLNNQAKPVFFVQVSQEPKNNFHKFYTNRRIDDYVEIGNDLFWLKASYKLDNGDTSAIMGAFDQFIRDAHSKILEQNSTKIDADNHVARLTLIADFLNLKKYYPEQYETIQSELNNLKMSVLKESLGADRKVGYEIRLNPYDQTMVASIAPGIYSISEDSITIHQFIDSLKTKLDLEHMNEVDLATAKQYVSSLMEYEKIGKLKKIYRDVFSDSTLIATSSTDLISIQGVAENSGSEDLLDIPEQTKDRNLEESIILGLSDYLIERTKQEAMFAFYENIYEEIFAKNTFLKDTLFYNFSSLIKPDFSKPQIFEPNLLLFKEAINEDFSQFPENLSKHPKIKSSPGGTTIFYTTRLISHLQRSSNLEEAFEALVEERARNIEETTPLERGFLFTAHLIEFLKHNNLPDAYDQIPEEQLNYLSELAAVWIASKYPDVLEIRDLQKLTIKIKRIYKDYMVLRQTITSIREELDKLQPSSDFEGYSEHQRNLTLKSIEAAVKLLSAGLDVVNHYTNEKFGEEELARIRAMKPQVIATINAWFYIKDKEYGRAASALIPIVSEIPAFEKNITELESLIEEVSKKLLSRIDVGKLNKDLTALKKGINADLGLLRTNTVVDFDSEAEIHEYLVKHHLLFLKPLTITALDTITNKYVLSIKHVDGVKIEGLITEIQNKLATISSDKLYKNLKKVSDLHKSIKAILDDWVDIGSLTDSEKKELLEAGEAFVIDYILMVEMNDDLKKLTAIAGEVSTAKTAGDVSKALWKYALPVASYRAKRKERGFALVNAYVGSGGVYDYDDSESRLVLLAPIGLEVGGRIGKKENGSLSLFIPVLDVGNVINYQIKDEQLKTNGDERTFKFENLISPGAFVMYGVSKRFPLSIGAGWQANPSRFAAMIAFDLPLFRLK